MIDFQYDRERIGKLGGLKQGELEAKTQQARGLVERARKDAFGGWVDLPEKYDRAELKRIEQLAERINADSDYLLCIGIGGSYLGHRAVIEALGGERRRTKVLYAGNALSASELNRVLALIEGRDFSINVISKSGTTLEPAVAFRIFRQELVRRYGEKGANRRIYATTDRSKGALREQAEACNWEALAVPDDIGGRYSVLSAVGLLPIATAGIDVRALLRGAEEERTATDGAVAEYAVVRNLLFNAGFETEVMANFESRFSYFNEWWKQLFGESEGKDGLGIFPASVIYSTDLHSLGQFMQDGRAHVIDGQKRRTLFESFVEIGDDGTKLTVPATAENLDGLKYLEGKSLAEIQRRACEATRKAHAEGGVPVLRMIMPKADARSLGGLIYFFELGCALSGFLMGVNPFDQPGVEAYKKEMFALLGKK